MPSSRRRQRAGSVPRAEGGPRRARRRRLSRRPRPHRAPASCSATAPICTAATPTSCSTASCVDQIVSLAARAPAAGAPEAALTQLRAALMDQLPPFNADIAPGLVPNVMTGRIANRLNLSGPNYLIDAACASSLLAVPDGDRGAADAGRSDLMLAGGVNASMPAEVYMVFTQLGALSRSSKVRPFDAGTDGTLLGEGLGIVVLKRLADARARRRPHLRRRERRGAVERRPRRSGCSRRASTARCWRSGAPTRTSDVDPETIGLVEAHGTGIPLGDRTEIQALREVFGERLGDLPRVAIGSVKSMIGHCIPAAGVAGLIKMALALLSPDRCRRRSATSRSPALGLETHAVLREHRDAALDAAARQGAARRDQRLRLRRHQHPRHPRGGARARRGAAPGALPAEARRVRRGRRRPRSPRRSSGCRPRSPARRRRLRSAAIAAAAARARRRFRPRPARDRGDDSPRPRRQARQGARADRRTGAASFQMRSGIYAADAASRAARSRSSSRARARNTRGCSRTSRWSFRSRGAGSISGTASSANEGSYRPSDCVFPPPTASSREVSERLERELFSLRDRLRVDVHGNQAMLRRARAPRPGGGRDARP